MLLGEYRLDNNQYKKYSDIEFDLYIKNRLNENPELSERFENIKTREYEQIINELNDGVLPNDLAEYLFNEYDLYKKLNKSEIISQDDIANMHYSKLNKKVFIFIIIGGMIGIVGITLLKFIYKKLTDKYNS